LKIFSDIEILSILTANTNNLTQSLKLYADLCASLQTCCCELSKQLDKEEKTCE
jgi:hypothetical protein